MQEWIIAMLVISVLLVLRVHGKSFFSGEEVSLKAEQPAEEKNPQKGEGGAVCCFFSEACRQLLWITLPKRLFKQRPGGWNYKGDL